MTGIKEFMILFLSVLTVSGIVLSLSPEGNVKRYIQYICMLCLTASLCVPILSTLSALPERITNFSAQYGGSESAKSGPDASTLLIAETKKEIERSVAEYVSGKYGCAREEITVEAVLQTDDIEAVEITELIVTLPDTSRAEAIRADLYEMFLRKTVITINRG